MDIKNIKIDIMIHKVNMFISSKIIDNMYFKKCTYFCYIYINIDKILVDILSKTSVFHVTKFNILGNLDVDTTFCQ